MDRDLIEATVPGLQQLYATRKYTVTQVTQWYLDRIARYDGIYRAVETVMDKEALAAFQLLSRTEGIIPALEPSHALAQVAKLAPTLPKDHIIVMNLCGRGDKDIFTVANALGTKL